MTLRECYTALGGNYEETLERMCNERLLERYVLRFPGDKAFPALSKAMTEGNYSDAFRAVHSLKGAASYLGFTGLYEAADALTEALRGSQEAPDDTIWNRVKEEHERVLLRIREFQGIS